MFESQTYVVTFNARDLQNALANIDSPPFLYPYHGDIFSTNQTIENEKNWEPGIDRVMDQFDGAWRDLAQL